MWSRPRGLSGTRSHSLSLAGQLLLVQLAVLSAVLVLVGLISVQQSTRTFEEERGSTLRGVAEDLSNQPLVRARIESLDAARSLAPVVSTAQAYSAAEEIGIADADGEVLASTDPTRNGEPAEIGDSRVVEGRGWSGEVDVDGTRTLAAHAPILDVDGRLLGFTMAEADYPTVWERLTLAAPDLLLYLGLGALLGVGGSVLVSRSVRRRTFGLRPAEIATLADHREALVFAIREGVIAVGTDGTVTMVNDSARRLLDLAGEPADVVGRPVTELGLGPVVERLLLDDEEARDVVAVVGERVLVFNQRAASSRGQGIGTVTTMRDRTELASMQSQLAANLSLTDTLRAQTHEFANQLHTISGLVQLEEYDEVVTLIGDMTRRRGELASRVTSRVADRALAALVVAKTSVADEAGVDLVLDERSRLGALPSDVSADLVTVVGNLVDNAVDACRGSARPTVSVLLLEDGAGTDHQVGVEVRDNGPGVPEELREQVFARGFSTKGEAVGGRGVGLALVQLVARQRGGVVTLERQDATTVFRVTLPLPAVPAPGSTVDGTGSSADGAGSSDSSGSTSGERVGR